MAKSGIDFRGFSGQIDSDTAGDKSREFLVGLHHVGSQGIHVHIYNNFFKIFIHIWTDFFHYIFLIFHFYVNKCFTKKLIYNVLCNACKRTQCTYRKEIRPVFLVVAA